MYLINALYPGIPELRKSYEEIDVVSHFASEVSLMIVALGFPQMTWDLALAILLKRCLKHHYHYKLVK